MVLVMCFMVRFFMCVNWMMVLRLRSSRFLVFLMKVVVVCCRVFLVMFVLLSLWSSVGVRVWCVGWLGFDIGIWCRCGLFISS